MAVEDPLVWSDGLLPSQLDLDTGPFWEAARERHLLYQVCGDCGGVVFFPRHHCPGCMGENVEWRDSGGRGVVYTFSIVRKSRDPRFGGRTPYCVAWIDLDEGFRMMSNVVNADPDKIRIGMSVQVTWAQSGEWLLPVFEPAGFP